jgi:hypothetical protein
MIMSIMRTVWIVGWYYEFLGGGSPLENYSRDGVQALGLVEGDMLITLGCIATMCRAMRTGFITFYSSLCKMMTRRTREKRSSTVNIGDKAPRLELDLGVGTCNLGDAHPQHHVEVSSLILHAKTNEERL